MFSYYGSKYLGARHFGKPRESLVIEPFAGSACYSLYWDCPLVKLYDIDETICEIWDFLINCSEQDIQSIPAMLDEDIFANITGAAKLLVSFWTSKGRAYPQSTLSPWYHNYKTGTDCRVWGEAVKRRIIEQKPLISQWTIERKSYAEIDTPRAHWHIDPPYIGKPGRKYRHNVIDYEHLADWIFSLSGDVDVCENLGATWLPFAALYQVNASRGAATGKVSKESVFRVRGKPLTTS